MNDASNAGLQAIAVALATDQEELERAGPILAFQYGAEVSSAILIGLSAARHGATLTLKVMVGNVGRVEAALRTIGAVAVVKSPSARTGSVQVQAFFPE